MSYITSAEGQAFYVSSFYKYYIIITHPHNRGNTFFYLRDMAKSESQGR